MDAETNKESDPQPSKRTCENEPSTRVGDNVAPPPISEEALVQAQSEHVMRLVPDLMKEQSAARVYMIDARSGGVYFSAEAHITGDVVGRSQKNKPIEPRRGSHGDSVVAFVLNDNLEKLLKVYVKPQPYTKAQQILKEKHILIIWGNAHWGKWSTALHLLSSLNLEEILEIRPDIAAEDLLGLDIGNGEGFAVDTLSPESAQKLSTSLLRGLGSYLRDKNGYLVITVDSGVTLSQSALCDYLVTWDELPHQEAVLQAHLDWHVSRKELFTSVSQLTQTDEVQKILHSNLLPGEIDRLAELLVKVLSSELSLRDALSRYSAHTSLQAEEWFESHTDLESRVFMISASVLSGTSYQTIIDAADQLKLLVEPSIEISGSSNSQLVFGSRRQRLAETLSHTVQGYIETEYGRNPVELLELNNPDLQPAILHFIWHEYDRLRRPLLLWLKDLGSQGGFAVRTRAAAAVGELSKYDFGYVKDEVLLAWANHPANTTRASAAFALGIPVWEGRLAPLVLGLLHHWSTLSGNWRLNWTAAAAYGGLVGLRFPDIALRDLYNVAKAKDLRLFAVLSRSIINLVHTGITEPEYYLRVLNALVEWTSDPTDKIVALTGLLIFLDLVKETTVHTDTVHSKESSPALWLLHSDVRYAESTTSLWRRALNTKTSRDPALQTLHELVRQADNNKSLLNSMEDLLTQLVKNATERERKRLRFYLNRWSSDSKEGSGSSGQLLTVIDKLGLLEISYGTDK